MSDSAVPNDIALPADRYKEFDNAMQLLQEMKIGYIALAERHRKLQEVHAELIAAVAAVYEA
jgi:hypothetical protein